MIEVLQILLNGGLIGGICFIAVVVGKCIVAGMISKNKDMSDEKAKSLVQMMSKDININLHQ